MNIKKTILVLAMTYLAGIITPKIFNEIQNRSPLERKISVSQEITGNKPYPTNNWQLYIYRNKIELFEPGFITRQPYSTSHYIIDTNRDGELDLWHQNITTRHLSEQEKKYWQPKYEQLLKKYNISTSHL